MPAMTSMENTYCYGYRTNKRSPKYIRNYLHRRKDRFPGPGLFFKNAVFTIRCPRIPFVNNEFAVDKFDFVQIDAPVLPVN